MISLLENFCSTIIASKKDKGKIDSKALVLKPKLNVVTSSSTSSVALANRFSPFSPELLIFYSSTLASPYDPFVDFSQKSRVPYVDYKKPSGYMPVPYFEHLFTIEMNRSSIRYPSELVLSYFPPYFHWIPEHPQKNLAFYINILIQTKSLYFKSNFLLDYCVCRKIKYSQLHESFAIKCVCKCEVDPQGIVFAKTNFLSK